MGKYTNHLVFCFILTFSFALGTTAFGCSEPTFSKCMKENVEPFYATQAKVGIFSGVDDVSVQYRLYLQESRSKLLVLLPGRTEPVKKYEEAIYDLYHAGFSILAMDHRGQGDSGRMTEDPEVGYVRSFQDYVDDVKTLFEKVVSVYPHREIFVMGSSMGGAIASLLVEQNPGIVDKAVLVSPMIRFRTEPYSFSFARKIVWTEVLLGRGKSYTIGAGPYNEKRSFLNNGLTSSETRFEWDKMRKILNPSIRIGGTSNRWVLEAARASDLVLKDSIYLTAPTLLLQATDDTVVVPEFQKEFCRRALWCEMRKIPGARHEILDERDQFRSIALEAIVSFLNK